MKEGQIIICPQCNGDGEVYVPIAFLSDTHEPKEYGNKVCDKCDGYGRLRVVFHKFMPQQKVKNDSLR